MINIKKTNLLSNIIYINIILLPVLLITGPFLSDLAISINGIIFIYLTLKKKNFEFFKIKLVQILIVLWISFIISSLFSEFKLHSLKSSLPYFRFILFVGSVYFVKDKLLKIDYTKFVVFILPSIAVSLDVIFQSYFGFNVFGIVTLDPSRNSSFFGGEFISGSYIVRMLPISLLYAFWLIEKKNNNNFFYLLFIFLLISTIAVLLSGERTAFFLILLFNIYFLFSFSKLKLFRIFFSFFLILTFISILSFSKTSYNRMVKDTFNDVGLNYIFNNYFLKKDHETSTAVNRLEGEPLLKQISPHLSHYYASILMYNDHKILGVGPRNFRKLCRQEKYIINSYSCSTHSHSTWIQILTEAGILPFVFLVLLFIIVMKNFYQFFTNNFKKNVNKNNDEKMIIFGAFLMTLWPLIPSGNFFNNWLSIIYFYPMGFYFIINQK